MSFPQNVYSKKHDMFGVATDYDHYNGLYTVELPTGVETLSRNDLEWEGADYETDLGV